MSKQKQLTIWFALISCFITGFAQAATTVNEVEPNNSPSGAQTLVTSGGATVNAAVGNNGTADPDQDWYTFYANAGDVVTIDIDGTTNGLDTVIGLYYSDGSLVDSNDDMLATLDPGSSNIYDSMLANKALADTGYYTVVVCASPCAPNGNYTLINLTMASTGNYQVLITGASGGSSGGSGTNSGGSTSSGGSSSSSPTPTSVMQVATQARPGKSDVDRFPINPRSRGTLQVIIYGGPQFNALTVDTGSLTFGSTGDEDSFKKCNYQGTDQNHDGRVDLMCMFSIQKANLDPTNAHAILKGKLKDDAGGTQFESSVFLKYVPDKR